MGWLCRQAAERFSCPPGLSGVSAVPSDRRGLSRSCCGLSPSPPTPCPRPGPPAPEACGNVTLTGPSLCPPPTVTVRVTDEVPELRRRSAGSGPRGESGAGVGAWVCSGPKAHASPGSLSPRPPPLGLPFWSAGYGSDRDAHTDWLSPPRARQCSENVTRRDSF